MHHLYAKKAINKIFAKRQIRYIKSPINTKNKSIAGIVNKPVIINRVNPILSIGIKSDIIMIIKVKPVKTNAKTRTI